MYCDLLQGNATVCHVVFGTPIKCIIKIQPGVFYPEHFEIQTRLNLKALKENHEIYR